MMVVSPKLMMVVSPKLMMVVSPKIKHHFLTRFPKTWRITMGVTGIGGTFVLTEVVCLPETQRWLIA